jgi:hypothetical protein
MVGRAQQGGGRVPHRAAQFRQQQVHVRPAVVAVLSRRNRSASSMSLRHPDSAGTGAR